MKITIKEIAKIANVSVATVSRVMNNKPEGVSAAKRQEIKAIMEAYHYTPNNIAQSMKTNRTQCIGLLIPDILNPFFQNIARGIEDQAEANGYHVFLCNTDNKPQKYVNYIEAMLRKKVDGLIITGYPTEVSNEVSQLLQNIKVVIMDRSVENNKFCQVVTDSLTAAYEMTKYLIEMGHKRIACITGPTDFYISQQRIKGYQKALDACGICYDEALIRTGDFAFESGEREGEWLITHTNATALFCFNDMMAHGVYKACEKLGKSIPDDLSVVGFDDIYTCQMIKPMLTTVKQPSYQIGEEAAKLLIEWITTNLPNNKRMVLPNQLILRESVKQL